MGVAKHLLQSRQLLRQFTVFGLYLRVLWRRHVARERRIAEEEGVVVHPRLAQHTVVDLQLGDTLVTIVLEPAVLGARLPVNALGPVAVTLAEDADEERPGLFDLLEAGVQRPVVVGRLLRHAPAHMLPTTGSSRRTEQYRYQQRPKSGEPLPHAFLRE